MKEISKEEIIDFVCRIVIEAKKYIGIGEEYARVADCEVTKLFDKLTNIIQIQEVLSIEGERDGISGGLLQNVYIKNRNRKEGYSVSVDPIDGTTACVRGGSRSNCALSVWKKTRQKYKKVPDSLSCFCAASNVDANFLKNICIENQHIGIFEKNKNYKPYIIATLHRSESEEVWKNILKINILQGIQGEKNFYLPNMLYENIFFAGDSSLTLPIESDCFLGRVGVAEARIEGALWKYWRGVLVSGRRMKKYSEGQMKYLIRRIGLAQSGKGNIDEFFEEDELRQLEMWGWKKEEIGGFLEKEIFIPEIKILIIATITGTKDRVLNTHSKYNLSGIEEVGKNRYKVEYILVTEDNPKLVIGEWEGNRV